MTVTARARSVNKNISQNKPKGETQVTSAPIRIRTNTKLKLEQLLRQVNKDRRGRRVKADDLISYSLDLLTDQHLASICDETLTNKDRLELLFSKLSKDQRGLTRDDFFGMLLAGKVNITGDSRVTSVETEVAQPRV